MKKIFKYSLLLTAIAVLAFFGYIRYGGYLLIDKSDRDKIISEIKSAPQLPDNFMKVYNDLYPNALKNSGWDYAFNGLVFHKYNECPSRDLAYLYGANRLHGAFFYLAQLNFVIENNVTQQQCLNKNLQKMDFRLGVQGVENASQHYFGKPLKELTEDEVLEFIVPLRNPSLYNRERKNRYRIFKDRFNSLKKQLEKNRKQN